MLDWPAIRDAYVAGATDTELHDRYGVSRVAVYNRRQRERWPIPPAACKQCGKRFRRRTVRQRFCSSACVDRHQVAAVKARRHRQAGGACPLCGCLMRTPGAKHCQDCARRAVARPYRGPRPVVPDGLSRDVTCPTCRAARETVTDTLGRTLDYCPRCRTSEPIARLASAHRLRPVPGH